MKIAEETMKPIPLFPAARGRHWRALWTPEADDLHRALADVLDADVHGMHDGETLLRYAIHRARATAPPAAHAAIEDAAGVMLEWLVAYGTVEHAGIRHMLRLRAVARGWRHE